jgi:hypothetical protein
MRGKSFAVILAAAATALRAGAAHAAGGEDIVLHGNGHGAAAACSFLSWEGR